MRVCFFFFLLYSSAHNLKSILHITCDELLEIGINLFFGIGNYDVIQNGGVCGRYHKRVLLQIVTKLGQHMSKEVKQQ